MKLKPRATYLKYSYRRPAESMHAAGLLSEQDSQSSLPCVGPGVCLWVSTDSSISLSFPTLNADVSSTTCYYNIASKTHSGMPLVALVSCQISQNIPHLFYCCLIDFPPPPDSTKHSQNIYLFDAMWFSTNCGKSWLPSQPLKDKSDAADNISLKIAPVPPHHDPAFRQLSLDLLLPSNSPCTSRGEHSPAWHTAVLGQWQSHEDKAKHGHWLTRTALGRCYFNSSQSQLPLGSLWPAMEDTSSPYKKQTGSLDLFEAEKIKFSSASEAARDSSAISFASIYFYQPFPTFPSLYQNLQFQIISWCKNKRLWHQTIQQKHSCGYLTPLALQ